LGYRLSTKRRRAIKRNVSVVESWREASACDHDQRRSPMVAKWRMLMLRTAPSQGLSLSSFNPSRIRRFRMSSSADKAKFGDELSYKDLAEIIIWSQSWSSKLPLPSHSHWRVSALESAKSTIYMGVSVVKYTPSLTNLLVCWVWTHVECIPGGSTRIHP